jgi:hypothetical protein
VTLSQVNANAGVEIEIPNPTTNAVAAAEDRSLAFMVVPHLQPKRA